MTEKEALQEIQSLAIYARQLATKYGFQNSEQVNEKASEWYSTNFPGRLMIFENLKINYD